MTQPLNFQQVILKLHEFWAAQGCVIWEPYNVQVGAGTANPATTLRVLGPEPWRVAYVEPSVRPDDGRFGENPNRMQKYYQYQVILKPDPGNPQELYLKSLEALGINPREHDIRFVEDNWESPALGAWGLGWEVWLDGQEITQFTYFQQAAGMELNPVSVELTYGIERIVLALQNKNSAWEIDWTADVTYHDMMFSDEVEHCNYYFNLADVDALKHVYDTYEREMGRALEGDAVISAYDYVLKCSHLFNVLDTRGAIGVTERAQYFRRMRDMTRITAQAYLEKRESLGFPMMKMQDKWGVSLPAFKPALPPAAKEPADVLLEIGVEELPAQDVDAALTQLQKAANTLFDDLRLSHGGISAYATPRRLLIAAKKVAAMQADIAEEVKGPPADRAFDADGKPTKVAEGYARSKGISVDDLVVKEIDGGQYVTAVVKTEGRPAIDVLAPAFEQLASSIKFGKGMRWNETDVVFSRPVRWLVALFGETVIPFQFAGVTSGNVTRGLRPYGSPEIAIADPNAYYDVMAQQGVILDRQQRRAAIVEQITALAKEVNGTIPDDPDLLAEVTNLIEAPVALRGTFEESRLSLPRDILVTVMRKHQRYFAVEDSDGKLMPYFIAVRNGDHEHLDKVIHGNEHVLRARFSDGNYFYKEDIKKPLADYLPRLGTLTFHEKLGSMLQKNERVASMVEGLGHILGIQATDITIAQRAAHIAKADLATQVVVEFTSLQGIMGRHYALREGQPPEVADAIFEHWLPRSAGDLLPVSNAGILLALTDKLDSLVGLFAIGLAPKSSADPFGLRRAALGIVQILIGRRLYLNLAEAVDFVAEAQPVSVGAQARAQVLDFIKGRLESLLVDEGDYPRDVINAVLAQQAHDPYRATVGMAELAQWVGRDDWEAILDSFARCVRITRSEPTTYDINPKAFTEPQTKALYSAYLAAAAKVDDDGNVDAFLVAFEPMIPAVTDFFDNVMVHDENLDLRHNRLGLLQAISALQTGRADLSELSGF